MELARGNKKEWNKIVKNDRKKAEEIYFALFGERI